MNGEWWRLAVVDDDGDAAIGIKSKEPFFLLFVGPDITFGLMSVKGAAQEGEILGAQRIAAGTGAYMTVVVNSVP